MHTWIIRGMLICTIFIGLPSLANASLLYNTIQAIQRLFKAEDMANTDWKGVAKDLHDNLNAKTFQKKMDKALGAPEKPASANEPEPKIRIAQYLFFALFFFIIVTVGILLLYMALRD